MANMRPALALRNAWADGINTLLNAGSGAATIEIYSGTIPTNADTAIGSQVLLAVLTCSDPAAPAASASVLTFSTITGDSSANATGTATWARFKDSTGATVFDCSVTATGGGGVITLNTVAIISGAPVSITSGTLTVPTS
jgi:hypothetical protein